MLYVYLNHRFLGPAQTEAEAHDIMAGYMDFLGAMDILTEADSGELALIGMFWTDGCGELSFTVCDVPGLGHVGPTEEWDGFAAEPEVKS